MELKSLTSDDLANGKFDLVVIELLPIISIIEHKKGLQIIFQMSLKTCKKLIFILYSFLSSTPPK
jgi:hypothetical protein